MVTRNRALLARRAIECFVSQTWANKELVIVDDGTEDYEAVLAPYRSGHRIVYLRLEPDANRTLGAARNISLDIASGEYCAQWDDDEWYHPERIAVQMDSISQGLDAVVFEYTLMHLDAPDFASHVYRASLPNGTPGTVLHKRSAVRYPDLKKGEDAIYLERLRESMRVGIASGAHSHLFIRCFHGTNTWSRDHFIRRLRRTRADKWRFFFATHVRRNMFTHPSFRLTALEQQTVDLFSAGSLAIGPSRLNR